VLLWLWALETLCQPVLHSRPVEQALAALLATFCRPRESATPYQLWLVAHLAWSHQVPCADRALSMACYWIRAELGPRKKRSCVACGVQLSVPLDTKLSKAQAAPWGSCRGRSLLCLRQVRRVKILGHMCIVGHGMGAYAMPPCHAHQLQSSTRMAPCQCILVDLEGLTSQPQGASPCSTHSNCMEPTSRAKAK